MEKNTEVKIIVTGAFGLIGRETVNSLTRSGYQPLCVELDTPENRLAASEYENKAGLRTVFLDITNEDEVHQTLLTEQPEIIIHLAMLIPPLCYLEPDRAFKVNVIGTQNLVKTARTLSSLKRFIYISSYSIHGARNPHKTSELITSVTALNPGDNYARHKVQSEHYLQASGVPWIILRLPAVFGLSQRGGGSDWLQYLLMMPPERRQHAMDARDAGLAITNAVEAPVLWQTLVLGGAQPDWTRTSEEFFGAIFRAQGMKSIPKRYFRQPDPKRDADWYYEDWVDSSESQKKLQYQNHTFSQYLKDLKKVKTPVPRWLMKLIAPLILKQLVRQSPYDRRKNGFDLRTHWHTVCDTFGIDHENGQTSA